MIGVILKKLIFIFFIVASSSALPQSQNFDSTVAAGIKQIYDIKFPEAEKTFRALIADFPGKPQGRFFLAMVDWWKILLNPDNDSYDDVFYQKLEDVIYQCDQILKQNPDDVNALFFKGGAIGFRGRLRAYRESWLKAADDGRTALPIVEHAAKLDPKNVDVQLGFGIYDYYAAVIPEEFPLMKPLMIFFPPGNKQKGISELNDVAMNGKYAKYEAQYFLMTLYFDYENNPIIADEYAKMLTTDFPDNPVFERWHGRIAAKKGDFLSASKIFSDVIAKADRNYPGYNTTSARREAVYYVAYEYKSMKQIDSSIIYFKECANLSKQIDVKETSGFLINSYLYLGMLYDLQGKRERAVEYYKKTLDLKDYNNSRFYAQEYLKTPYKN